MARPLDEPIPDAEELYRTIRPAWVDDAGELSTDAFDPDGTSVYREKYCAPPAKACDFAAAEGRPEETAICMITPATLPAPVVTAGGTRWEFFVVDFPTDDCIAHSEIRFRHEGETDREGRRVKKSAQRLQIKEALARAFTHQPLPPAPA